LAAVLAAVLLLTDAAAEQPLFDAHLHYSAADARTLSPGAILEVLERNRVRRAIVSGTPAAHTAALYQHAPDRIVPFLSVYRSEADKADWPLDESLAARVEQALKEGPWQGVGELHIFARHRHSPVFRRIVEIATERGRPLQIHADPAVIDALFDHRPGATVLWAHAGAYPFPALLADYLDRYPSLYVDLSVRDERVAPDGQIDPEWEALLVEHSERFLVGVDSFSTDRWRRFDQVAEGIRGWLGQLPPGVAERIAYRNAERLFPARR
jgi:predicted TIM-barrel fold metal-dependent hydrolase